MTAHFITVTIMSAFCLLQTLSGLQHHAYMLLVLVLGYTPVLMEYSCWKKTTKTPAIKHLIAIGFAVFYTFCLFTSTNNLVFALVIPMILLISVYNDSRYSLLINLGTVIENFLVVILGARTGGFGYAGLDSSIIQITVILMVAMFSYMTAQVSHINLSQKLLQLQSVSQQTEHAISEIHTELQKLNESSQATGLAMKNVTDGTADTANAVQNQLLQTEEIQNQIDVVNSTASMILENIRQTLSFVQNGNEDMTQLVNQVDTSVTTSADAIEKLHRLEDRMKEMETISQLIDDIAFQTNIMALNANVEAAHSGDAGRGFAVIASQISEMSIRTKAATEDITTLINNVFVSINEVVEVINQIISDIHKEKQCTTRTFENFSSIQSHTDMIHDHVSQLVNTLNELATANRRISDSVQTISAASEEVSALAIEAMSSENHNAQITNVISEKMTQLVKDTSVSEDNC